MWLITAINVVCNRDKLKETLQPEKGKYVTDKPHLYIPAVLNMSIAS